MTKPTVPKHWRKPVGLSDKAWIHADERLLQLTSHKLPGVVYLATHIHYSVSLFIHCIWRRISQYDTMLYSVAWLQQKNANKPTRFICNMTKTCWPMFQETVESYSSSYIHYTTHPFWPHEIFHKEHKTSYEMLAVSDSETPTNMLW